MVKKELINYKKWYHSKTLWANTLITLAGILTAISSDLTTGSTITIIGIANIVLRVITSTKIE